MEEDLTIEIDDELHEMLKREADERGISVEDHARQKLIASVRNPEPVVKITA